MVRMDLTDNLGHLANTEQMVKTAKLAIQVSWDLVELLDLAALEDKLEQVQFLTLVILFKIVSVFIINK
jgi:hypothetical protein